VNDVLTDEQVQAIMPHRPNVNTAFGIADEIMSGRIDTSLDIIAQALLKRRKQIAENRAMSLSVGDRVRIQGVGMGAKYLNGMMATVTGFATKNIRIKIDAHYDTRRYGHELRMPPGLLRLVRQDPAGEIEAVNG